MKDLYGHYFYVDRHQKTIYSARTVLSLVLGALPPVHSAIDIGCGLGTWLSVLKEKGVSEIHGVDGHWVEEKLLKIPKNNFQTINFKEKIVNERRFDLAITLEVAEHISLESISRFVNFIVGASDFVLFSAAIPYQGGIGHINEQWPDYWVNRFSVKGYVAVDFIRQKIWSDHKIPFWYRQNILLFVKQERISSLRLERFNALNINLPISIVHPDLYLSKIGQMSSVRGSFGLFWRAVKDRIKKRCCKGRISKK